MKILVIGSGGREHCLAWKLSKSLQVEKVYCAPGNGGTSAVAENVNINPGDIAGLLAFALKEKIDLTVVGPEMPLVFGIVDKFVENGLNIFGPCKELAMLEGSKVFAKQLMKKYRIPTAAFETFNDADKARQYVKSKGVPIVIKADGLAAGKGVVVCTTVNEALGAIDLMMEEKAFGRAGERVVIEQCLDGEEASLLVLTDGDTIIPLAGSQDHKRAFDDDSGPNTGGMGAYSPAPVLSPQMLEKVMNKVCQPLIRGLRDDGKIYKGILYVGLMIKNNQPSVLEFNVRFGDPETQAIIPKLKSDFADAMLKTAQGKLHEAVLEWDERFCVCVVLAAGGYPGDYAKGKQIFGLENLENMEDVYVFHAGTKNKEVVVTDGGRVLNVCALSPSIKDAQEKAYAAIKRITFEGMLYRKDIGSKALKFIGPAVK